MSLLEKQQLFSELIAKHITWLYSQGYKVTCGDFFAKIRTPLEHKKKSLHYDKCAGDLNLFRDGKFIENSSDNDANPNNDHAASGAHWESLHPMCRWGGRYGDGNHYELLEWR